MMGTTDLESAQIDAICESVRDFKEMYQKVRSLSEEDKEAGTNEWFTVTLVERLSLLEHQMVGETGFSVGSSITLSDVVLYTYVTQFFDNKEASYNATLATPKIRAIVDRVSSHAEVVSWLDRRPKTSF
jgi:glutathione S-transferase